MGRHQVMPECKRILARYVVLKTGTHLMRVTHPIPDFSDGSSETPRNSSCVMRPTSIKDKPNRIRTDW
jgi:hypothetical protein